jgi:uncharacterized protein YceH (UPF0502 family)
VQLLGGQPPGEAGGAEQERSVDVESAVSAPAPLEERVARLEQQVAALQRALERR